MLHENSWICKLNKICLTFYSLLVLTHVSAWVFSAVQLANIFRDNSPTNDHVPLSMYFFGTDYLEIIIIESCLRLGVIVATLCLLSGWKYHYKSNRILVLQIMVCGFLSVLPVINIFIEMSALILLIVLAHRRALIFTHRKEPNFDTRK